MHKHDLDSIQGSQSQDCTGRMDHDQNFFKHARKANTKSPPSKRKKEFVPTV